MKRWLSVVAIVILCLALVIGAACKGEKEEGVKEVKIGIALPLGGILGATVGVPGKQGFELAAEKIGEFTVAGKSYHWNLIFEDNQGTSAGGVASATKFIHEYGVKFMHQYGSDAGMAAQRLCEESGVLLDMSAGLMEAFGPDKPHTFQMCPTYRVHSPIFFQWLTTAHPEVKTVVGAMNDDAVGHEIIDAAVSSARYFGLEVLGTEFIPVGTMEMYPTATKLAHMNADLTVMMPGGCFGSMREMDYEGRGAFIMWMTASGEQAGWNKVQGYLVYQPNPYGEELPQAAKDFAAEYEQRYHAELTQGPYYAVTILYVLTDALKKAGTVDDVDKIIQVLETESFDTLVGPLRFGGEELIGINHWLLWPAPIAEISDHDYHVVAQFTPEEAYELAVEVFGK